MSLVRYLPTPSDRMGILWSLLSVEGSVILEYGPAGTTHYSMSLFGELGIDQENHLFSTHMSEDDVVMGDVTRLEQALIEVDEGYQPKVIFVVASSVSAIIGTDLRGVCAYMQEKINARLIAFEQGGFRGDYSIGIKEAYRLLVEQLAEASVEKKADTYNILGASAWAYRNASDVNEIRRLMKEAFGMECHACLCHETSAEAIRTMGCAEVNLVLRDEALPAARFLQDKYGTPIAEGVPYGYEGTLNWLEQIAKLLGREINPRMVAHLKKRIADIRQYRMYGIMLKVNKPAATIIGEYMTVQGIASLLTDLGFPALNKVSSHCLRAIENPVEDVKHLPEEKDRIDLLKGLHHHFVLADDVSRRLLAEDNTFMRVSLPLVDGTIVANHMPLMGDRGADMIIESLEQYLQTLK